MRDPIKLLALTLLPTLLQAQGIGEARILDDPKGAMAKISEQAFLMKPHDAEVMAKCGYLQFAAGNRKKAEELFGLATNLKPKNGDIRYYIALSYLKFGKPEESSKAFHDMLVADPSNQGLLAKAAEVLFEAGQPEDATRMAQRAYALDPSDRGLCLDMARLAYRFGDKELGARYVQRAKETLKGSDASDLLDVGLALADQEGHGPSPNPGGPASIAAPSR